MYQEVINQPGLTVEAPLSHDVYDAMYEIFKNIGIFWGNMDDSESYRTRLITFMDNRMSLRPQYRQYYMIAKKTMDQLVADLGETAAYEKLFTDPEANVPHTNTPLAITRQKVSNEFITFQLNEGGFKAFGAKNSPGYISGAYIPGQPAPYRTVGE